MDRSAAAFKSMSADVKWVEHTAVINDDAVDSGTMKLKRSKRDIRALVEFMEPDRKSVSLHEKKVEIYYPKIQTIEEYDVGAHRELLNQFLLIGFGTSGKELAEEYNMNVLGNETVDVQKTTRLELVPKSPDALKHLKKLEIWLGENGYPVQQKFYLPAGDYKLVTYTNVKVNVPLSDADLKLKVPKDAKRVYPQK